MAANSAGFSLPHEKWLKVQHLVQPIDSAFSNELLLNFPDLDIASFHSTGFHNESEIHGFNHKFRHGGFG